MCRTATGDRTVPCVAPDGGALPQECERIDVDGITEPTDGIDKPIGRLERWAISEAREFGQHLHGGAYRTGVDELSPDVAAAIDAHPIAAAALELLLSSTESADVESALVTESATYSTLQAGPEHRAWLQQRTRRFRTAERDVVLMSRDGPTLQLTLNRPHVRNAFDAAMREALLDGLTIATTDPSVEKIVIDGAGPNFCSGGDLNEFGTLEDPASAHLLRVHRSVGRAIHRLRDRTTVVVHGACIGAGVELPAFAGRVIARSDATFSLPEISMGLVPGAGGTVSIPRRIGRQRFAWLALTGAMIDAPTARSWGLVDEIIEGA